MVVSRSTEQKEAPANARAKANIYGHARPLRRSLFPASTNTIAMVMFCAAWTLVDRRTQARYDRIMEFVVAVVVRRQQYVSLAQATLEVKFKSERCDLLSFGERPSLDYAETLQSTYVTYCNQWCPVVQNIVADVAMHSNPDDLPDPEKRAPQSFHAPNTSENRHDAGWST